MKKNYTLALDQNIEEIEESYKYLFLAISCIAWLDKETIESSSNIENINLAVDTIYKSNKALNKEKIQSEILNNIRLIKKIIDSQPNAIIFDCDGTLVQTEAINKLTFKEILKPNKDKLTPLEIQEIYQNQVSYAIENIEDDKEIKEILEEVFKKEIESKKQEYEHSPYKVILGILIDEENEIIEEKKLLFVSLLLSSLIKGLTFNAAFNTILTLRLPGQFNDIQEFRKSFRFHNKGIKESVGVESTLGTREFLEENSTPYIVASNSPNFVILENTQQLNIPQEKILSSHDLEKKRGKPYPDVFLLALKKLNSESSKTIIIEDSKPGVLAGLSAGVCSTFAKQISTKLNSFISTIATSEKQKVKMINTIERKITETITNEKYMDTIIETLERIIFGPIYLLGENCIETGVKKVHDNLLKSEILEELTDQINQIIIDSNSETEKKLLTKEILKMYLNFITENTLNNLPQIIIFNNGENQALCDHQSFLSISDMKNLNILLNQDK